MLDFYMKRLKKESVNVNHKAVIRLVFLFFCLEFHASNASQRFFKTIIYAAYTAFFQVGIFFNIRLRFGLSLLCAKENILLYSLLG